MSEELTYTAFVKYLDQENACEIDAGEELITFEPDDGDDEYIETIIEDILVAKGCDLDLCEVVAVVNGRFENIDEFWNAIKDKEEYETEKIRKEAEEQKWNEYLIHNISMKGESHE